MGWPVSCSGSVVKLAGRLCLAQGSPSPLLQKPTLQPQWYQSLATYMHMFVPLLLLSIFLSYKVYSHHTSSTNFSFTINKKFPTSKSKGHIMTLTQGWTIYPHNKIQPLACSPQHFPTPVSKFLQIILLPGNIQSVFCPFPLPITVSQIPWAPCWIWKRTVVA